jgi:hypothetical protein
MKLILKIIAIIAGFFGLRSFLKYVNYKDEYPVMKPPR